MVEGRLLVLLARVPAEVLNSRFAGDGVEMPSPLVLVDLPLVVMSHRLVEVVGHR